MTAMARDPVASDPEFCARADRILEHLRSGVPVGVAREIPAALTATNLRDLLERLEAGLGTRTAPGDRVLCVLVIAPESTPAFHPNAAPDGHSTGVATA